MSKRQVAATNTVKEHQRAQNYSLIWVDGKLDFTKDELKKSLAQLRTIVSDVITCKTPTECIEHLNVLKEGKAFVISSGAFGQHLMDDIHHLPIVDTIYIFCANKVQYEQWTKNWSKVEGVHTSVKPICDSLKKITHACDHNDITMNFIPEIAITTADGSDQQNLDHVPELYMYSVIFKEIILDIQDNNEKQMNDFMAYCRQKQVPESQLIDFQKRYQQKSPLWWYTCGIFVHGLLSKVLRLFDIAGMMKIGFFIRHLHRQLEQLYQVQSADFREEFIVYRGQGITKHEFQGLYNSQGGFVSFNNFLSTNKDKEVSMQIVQHSMKKYEDIVGVLFIMTIDPTKISSRTTPFALIDNESALEVKEKEILFTINTAFRIIDFKQPIKNKWFYEVKLLLIDDNDPQMAALTTRMKEATSGSEWYRMSNLMVQMERFRQVEELYNELLKDATNDRDKESIYQQLGRLKDEQGEYQEAAAYYEKSLKTKPKSVSEDDVSLASTYNSIALACNNMGDYVKALEFYDKSHRIYEKVLSPSHPDLITSFRNIGGVYNSIGDYSKALQFYEKGVEIAKKALSATHPDLASYYGKIGQVYNNMGDYSKALEYIAKSKSILEQSLSENHPDLALEYSWFGKIYHGMKEYPRSLENFQKCLKIRQQVLGENHPHVAIAYSDVGDTYRLMGDYQKALKFHQNALDIQENVKCNLLDCATTYVNLGETYRDLKDYSTALKYSEKGLKIREEKLPKNHPDLAEVYYNMSKLCLATRQHSAAKKYIQQAVNIAKEKLPSTHPRLLEYCETLDEICKN